MHSKIRILVLALALLLATAPAHTSVLADEGENDDDETNSGEGGGDVNNLLPTVESFSNQEGGTAVVGSTDILSGTVKDVNGEQDLETLRVTVTTPDDDSDDFDLDVSGVDWSDVTSKPSAFTDGWKVWNSGDARDGVVAFELTYTYEDTGTHTFTTDASDGDFGDPAEELEVAVSHAIEVTSGFVSGDGSVDEESRWGGWQADPGAELVLASNYLKVVNTGDDDEQEFTVDFSSIAFTGASDETWEIDIDDNIAFACAEGRDDQTPDDLTFTFDPLSATGSATCAFTEGSASGDGVMYVQYRIEEIPEPMMNQAYAASFTVSS